MNGYQLGKYNASLAKLFHQHYNYLLIDEFEGSTVYINLMLIE